MNCKGCGKTIFKNDCKKVADWTFCLDCFDALMNPTEQKIEPGEPQLLDKKESLEHKTTANTCKICEKKIDKGKEKKLGIWTLCESCHAELTFKAPKKPMSDQDETQDPIVEDTQEEERKERERIKGNKTIHCSRCGRTILAVAAKTDGDNALCPDCFYNEPNGNL